MDIQYMKRAIELAKKGIGNVHPNPLVGAGIGKNGQIIITNAVNFMLNAMQL